MKIKEVPVFNEDGSIEYIQVVGPEEAQQLLQFALNFFVAHGFSAMKPPATEKIKPKLND